MNRVLLAGAALLLSACVSENAAALLAESVADAERAPVAEGSVLHQGITIGFVAGGRTGSYDTSSNSDLITDEQMEKALRSVLSNRAMLAGEGVPGDYLVNARVLDSRFPVMSMMNYAVTTKVAYEVVDRATDRVVFATEVEATRTANPGVSRIPLTRMAFSIAESAHYNATEFADQLEAALSEDAPASAGD